jgi:hypothetical protein
MLNNAGAELPLGRAIQILSVLSNIPFSSPLISPEQIVVHGNWNTTRHLAAMITTLRTARNKDLITIPPHEGRTLLSPD